MVLKLSKNHRLLDEISPGPNPGYHWIRRGINPQKEVFIGQTMGRRGKSGFFVGSGAR